MIAKFETPEIERNVILTITESEATTLLALVGKIYGGTDTVQHIYDALQDIGLDGNNFKGVLEGKYTVKETP